MTPVPIRKVRSYRVLQLAAVYRERNLADLNYFLRGRNG